MAAALELEHGGASTKVGAMTIAAESCAAKFKKMAARSSKTSMRKNFSSHLAHFYIPKCSAIAVWVGVNNYRVCLRPDDQMFSSKIPVGFARFAAPDCAHSLSKRHGPR